MPSYTWLQTVYSQPIFIGQKKRTFQAGRTVSVKALSEIVTTMVQGDGSHKIRTYIDARDRGSAKMFRQ